MTRFLVTGIPRSRTAWLANLLTYDGLYCQHDALRKKPEAEWPDLFRVHGVEASGIADSAAAVMYQACDRRRLFEDTRLILVWRNQDDCAESMAKNLGLTLPAAKEVARRAADGLNYIAKHYETHNVVYEALSRPYELEGIWRYITDRPFNYDRAAELSRLNVQVCRHGMLDGIDRSWLSVAKEI